MADILQEISGDSSVSAEWLAAVPLLLLLLSFAASCLLLTPL